MSLFLKNINKAFLVIPFIIFLSCKKEDKEIGSSGTNRVEVYLDGVKYEPKNYTYHVDGEPKVENGVKLALVSQFGTIYKGDTEIEDFANAIKNFGSTINLNLEELSFFSFYLGNGVYSNPMDTPSLVPGIYPLKHNSFEGQARMNYEIYRKEGDLAGETRYTSEPNSGSFELIHFDENVISGKITGTLVSSRQSAKPISVIVKFDYNVKTINNKFFN